MVENTPVVTVVMAVYNAAKTLPKAIESVLCQTLDNWRMICVNDGSTDNSQDLLEEYSRRDSRIMVLYQDNQGPAAARARAYERLETPYAILLDADDYYSPELLRHCIDSALKTDADIVLPDVKIELSDGSYMDWNISYHWQPGMEMSGREAFAKTFIQPSIHGWNMWKTELLKRFAVGDNATYNKLNADEYIQRLLFLNSKKVVISEGTYYYTCNTESITKKFSVRQLGYLDSCRKLIELIEPYHLDAQLASTIKEYYFRHIIHLQLRLYKDGDGVKPVDKAVMRKTIRKAYAEAMSFKKDFAFRDKSHPQLYRLVLTSGYAAFCLTCFLFAVYLKHKNKYHD